MSRFDQSTRQGPGGTSPAECGLHWSTVDPQQFAEDFGLKVRPTRFPRRSRYSDPDTRRGAAARWQGVVENAGPRQAAARRSLFAWTLACADVLAALGAVLLVSFLDHQSVGPLVLLVVPAILLMSKVAGLYDRDDAVIRRSTLDEAPALFQYATLAALGAWLAEGLLSTAPLHRGAVLGAWLGFFVLLVVLRTIARRAAHRAAPEERILFVGDRGSYDRFLAKAPNDGRLGIRIIGWVPLEGPAIGAGVLGATPDLPALVLAHDVHRVVLSGSGQETVLDVVRLMKLMGVQVSLLPALLDVVGTSVQFEDFQGLPLMGVRSLRLSRSSRFVKRAVDIAGAGVVLLAGLPLVALVATAVKLDSPGPVLFRQRRVGRDGRTFRMFKFRSMVADAEARKGALLHLNETDGFFKMTDDPRVTRVGRWLRRSSLDELPQLFNVLRGEMSLVGPRPLIEDDDQQVRGWQRHRLQLTPGMTGPWQVLGSSQVPIAEMVKLDYLYVANWSLWNDIKLLFRTVPLVVGFRGH